MPIRSCNNCGWASLDPQKCQLIGYQYASNRNLSCPYWTQELPTCDRCHSIDASTSLHILPSGTIKRLCRKCSALSGTCGDCASRTACDFETNPSPTPKTVQKRIRQGNGIAIVTEKNDKRVQETCRKNCQCFDQESNSCNRENNCCDNYNIIDFL